MKTVGVIGGMGPKATIDFLNKIISLTPAKKDQEHLRMIIDMNPQIPDRTEAIIGKGKSPLPELINSARRLELSGAHFIVIPCVTAHYWLDDIQRAIHIPLLSIIEASLERVKKEFSRVKKIGILATTGVIKSKIFNRAFVPAAYKIITPTSKEQLNYVMRGIYEIKAGKDPSKVKAIFLHACEHLIEKSAQLVIAGCTEISLAIAEEDIGMPLIDINETLAQQTIKFAIYAP